MNTKALSCRVRRLTALAAGFALAAVLLPRNAVADSVSTLTFEITQAGSNVVVTAFGSVDLAGSTFFTTTVSEGALIPGYAALGVGPYAAADPAYQLENSLGPYSFGTTTALYEATSATGDSFGWNGTAEGVFVPVGYSSGDLLSATATFDNTTIAGLGLTPGAYTWTYGASGQDSIVVNIGEASAPEPASWLLLLSGLALLAGLARASARTGVLTA